MSQAGKGDDPEPHAPFKVRMTPWLATSDALGPGEMLADGAALAEEEGLGNGLVTGEALLEGSGVGLPAGHGLNSLHREWPCLVFVSLHLPHWPC